MEATGVSVVVSSRRRFIVPSAAQDFPSHGVCRAASFSVVWAFTLFVVGGCWAASASEFYPYISPTPGSQWVSRHNNVVIRSAAVLDRANLGAMALTGIGSRSGTHGGTPRLLEDSETI